MMKIISDICGKLLDLRAIYLFLHQRRQKSTGEKIRVAFLCQYIPAWNKMQPVYEKMKEDSRFEVLLLCVPSGIQDQKLLNPDVPGNDTYDYFVQQGYPAVDTRIGREEWLDLQELKLDYIFYTRPYNSYMPPSYASGVVSRHTRICCLVYAISLTCQVQAVVLNRDFFRNVYYYFAENDYARKWNQKQLWLAHKLGVQKSLFYGMPALAQIQEAEGQKNHAWDFSQNEFRVMWTPRWTTNPELGGSNFFTFRESFLEYAKRHEEKDFLFRPHPMMFENFIRTGEMTEEEVHDYYTKVNELKNVSLDVEKEYSATFWNSSVLVTDISGMLPEYYVTGKPIIYCSQNMKLEPTDMTRRMLEGCYVVESEEELFTCLDELSTGNDRKRELRWKIRQELFGNSSEASAKIVEELVRGRKRGK